MEKQDSCRVLIVDDHATIRQGLRSVLEDYADIEVVGDATNGEEAVVKVGDLMPCVVVMDINMPRMNGIEATERIKKQHPHVIIVGISINADQDSQEAMQKAGAASLVAKEAAVEQLYSAIQNARSK